MHKKIIYSFLFIFLVSNKTIAQSKNKNAVDDAVKGLTKAMIDADKTVLEKYTSDKLSYRHSSGMVQNQNEFVDAIVSGRSDFVTIDLTDQTISVTGKTAIVRHKLSATTNDGGKPGTVKLSILLVWQKLHGQWKLIARQAVKIV
ncbi:MAG TPA: nuclear transport factor 2 family protein [Chitinophagaceae bacterium]